MDREGNTRRFLGQGIGNRFFETVGNREKNFGARIENRKKYFGLR